MSYGVHQENIDTRKYETPELTFKQKAAKVIMNAVGVIAAGLGLTGISMEFAKPQLFDTLPLISKLHLQDTLLNISQLQLEIPKFVIYDGAILIIAFAAFKIASNIHQEYVEVHYVVDEADLNKTKVLNDNE